MTIKFDGSITLAASVTDIDRSIQWFKDTLGFEEIFRAPEAGWAEITTPAEGISIGLGQTEEVDGKGGTTPVFGVADINAARAELEARDVKFDGDTIEIPGLVKLATFYDPDGNTYMLAESAMNQ
ncbi:MAG: VOC family protein [Proteobacteria bacterium]|nr:VOC family protein [Pseudomonadota bacterium]MDA1299358.1 VOC family protein [Pseudomonadota bacterium]